MRESKFFDEVLHEGRLQITLRIIRTRFGNAVTAELQDAIAALTDDDLINELADLVVTCKDFREFRRKCEQHLFVDA